MAISEDSSPGSKTFANLDWMQDRPSLTLTPYQQLIRSIDWSKSEFGPMKSWRRELRQTVRFMMAEINPVILYWGENCSIIYNEAHISMVGKNHPRMLGMNAGDVFPEFWEFFANIMDEQRLTGQTRVGEAAMLLMERHGFLEETYFSWKLIPIIGDDGVMLGGYGIPNEASKEIISSRRAACIQSLTRQVGTANSFDQLWQATVTGLSENDTDIPIALLYSIEQQSSAMDASLKPATSCKLEALLGIPNDHPCAEQQVHIQHNTQAFAHHLFSALNNKSVQAVEVVGTDFERLFDNLVWRGFGIPIQELVFVPIIGDGAVEAVLVLGLNPRLRFTSTYREFVQTIANTISSQLSRLRLAAAVESQEQIARSAVSEFQRSEMKFSRFAERSPLGLALTDNNGKVMYANEAWYSFCGLQPSQTEFSSWVDTVYEDDLPIINEWWYKVINLKQSGTFQIRSKRPFASGGMKLPYRTGIVAIYPDLDDNGDVATVMGLVTDISELKWIEQQLLLRQREIEESEKKYRDFAEHAPIGVVRTDAMGYVTFANNAWRSFYNFDEDHIFTEPQPWLASLNKEDAPLARMFFEDISRTQMPRTIEVRLKQRKFPGDAHRATPSEFWLLATGFAEKNPDGSLDSIVFWVTDISDQKAAERILTDKMEEAIRLKNTQERFVDMISHEIRNPLSAILHCGEEVVDTMKKCLASFDAQDRTRLLSHDKSLLETFASNVNTALDAANIILYCVQHQKQIVDDVLTLSKLDADLLVVSPVPVQPTELVRSALKMFEPELKSSAIDLAFEIRPSLEELDVDWVMLDPNRFLQVVINLVTNAIKFTRNSNTRRIVITVSAREQKPPQQHRGVHYIPKREASRNMDEIMLSDETDEVSSKELYLCFEVADTGKGLTESERTILFNRFAQASPKTHIEYGGSGLGLFISRQITEMLGGEIGVGSQPGKGATFAFYIRTRRTKPPRRASLGIESVSNYEKTLVTPSPDDWVEEDKQHPRIDESKQSDIPLPRTPEPLTRKRRVLVVEDNLVNQKVLCKQLRNRGFQVDAANHGREALDILDKVERDDHTTYFDVILCDIEMPVMDGIECVAEIRRLEKDGTFNGHIPIIGVTANVRSKQVNSAIEAGMVSAVMALVISTVSSTIADME